MYLLRQVAAADGTDLGRPSLADYYSSKGETPGRWIGHGLAALGQPIGRDPTDPPSKSSGRCPTGREVREDQMKALFGEGLHPNADQITQPPDRCRCRPRPVPRRRASSVAHSGSTPNENEWTRRLRRAYADYNTTLGAERPTPRSAATYAPTSAPPWAGRCSPKPTAANRPTTAN